jgi:hypothetical protein
MAAAERKISLCHRLARYLIPALGINVLRVKVNAAGPLNGIKGNTDALKIIYVLNPVEYAEIQHWLNVKDGLFAVIKDKGQGVIVARTNFFYGRIHRSFSLLKRLNFERLLSIHHQFPNIL